MGEITYLALYSQKWSWSLQADVSNFKALEWFGGRVLNVKQNKTNEQKNIQPIINPEKEKNPA